MSAGAEARYDLIERTAAFGEKVIRFARKIPRDAAAVPDLREEGRVLWQEAKELNLIFGKITRSME